MVDRIEEGQIKGAVSSLTIKDTEQIILQMKTSICIIKGKLNGTGFFCNINIDNEDIPCLITNYHVLDDKYIKKNKKILISMNDKQINEEISINEKDIVYISDNNEYDLIIIKLNKKEDYINFLELDENLLNRNSELGYKEESIYILHYPNSSKASVSYGYGILYDQKSKYDIIHKCNTLSGSSGGPILNLSTQKVIGIHKSFIPSKGYNLGTLLKKPLNSLKNEIKLKIKIDDCFKDVYFLDNTDYIDTKGKWHLHDNLEELNEENTELYINEKRYKFSKFFRIEESDVYSIRIKFKNPIKNCRYMFCMCPVESIDLSSFDSRNVTNMEGMFSNCTFLESVDLSSLDARNVTNMKCMLFNCQKIKYLDISFFDTRNVTNMEYMFFNCQKIKYLDLSSFDTRNVTNMEYMFSECFNLIFIELSSFNAKNLTNIKYMFHPNNSLKKIKITREFYEKIKDNLETDIEIIYV